MANADIQIMTAASELNTTSKQQDFAEALDRIADAGRVDEQGIAELMLCLDDHSDNLDLTWALLHLLEREPPLPYVRAFVSVLPEMLKRGNQEWADTITARLLNDPPNDLLLLDTVAQFADASRHLTDVLRGIAQRTSEVAKRAQRALESIKAR